MSARKKKRRKKGGPAKKPASTGAAPEASASTSAPEKPRSTERASKGTSGDDAGRSAGGIGAKRWVDDAFLVLAAVLTFARGVPRALMESWDDQRFLVEFEPVQAISLDNLVAIWSEPHFEAYHPLHLMAYWLDVPFAGPNGPVIHAVNLALFAGALLLVRRVLLGWGLGRLPALLATLAYGLHPVQVEAVTWAAISVNLDIGLTKHHFI